MALTVTDRGVASDSTGATTYAITLPQNCTARAMVVLCLTCDNTGSLGADPFLAITDSLGNTWTSRVNGLYDPGAANFGLAMRIFTTPQNAGALTTSDTITIDFGAFSVPAKACALFEITSTGGAPLYVTGAAGAGGASNAPSIATGTIGIGNAVIGFAGCESGTDDWVEDADTTNGAWSTHQHTGVGTGAAGAALTAQSKVVTASGVQTYDPTKTTIVDVMPSWIEIRESLLDGGMGLGLGIGL